MTEDEEKGPTRYLDEALAVETGKKITSILQYKAWLEKMLVDEDLVVVKHEQLAELMTQLEVYKSDIIALVNVFGSFSTLFSGKSNALAIGAAVVKIIGDKSQLEKLSHIIPIIEKYTATNG